MVVEIKQGTLESLL